MRRVLIILSGLLTLGMQSVCFSAMVQPSNVIIFVSFSMPAASLKGWMQEAELIHAPVVIRGLINHSFKDTIQKMAELTNDHHGGVVIDPRLFKRFQIQAVPAVVMTNNPNCFSNENCREDYDVIEGDVHLDYALKKMADQHDQLAWIAQRALTLLHENNHA